MFKFNKKAAAGIQIYLMIIAIFAFAFILNASPVKSLEETTEQKEVRRDARSDSATRSTIATSTWLPVGAGLKQHFTNKALVNSIKDYANTADAAFEWGPQIAGIISGALYATAASYAVQGVAKMLGQEDQVKEVAALSAFAGTWAGLEAGAAAATQWQAADGFWQATEAILNPFQLGAQTATTSGAGAGGAAAGSQTGTFLGFGPFFWIALAYAVYTYLTTEEIEVEIDAVGFSCFSWQPPTGGADCERCNDFEVPCSEYRCKSLGTGCGLVNQGTEKEKCIWLNPRDVQSPGIKPAYGVITAGYQYGSVRERPEGGASGSHGMTLIKQGGGCIEAFTPIEFGIENNEPAQCKIAYEHTKDFDEMTYYIGQDNMFSYNHSQMLSFPTKESLNNSISPTRQEDGTYALYIRCMDGNGNKNTDEFAVEFCIDEGPDLTPPIIKATSIADGSPVQKGTDEARLNVYTNEPSDCKWDIVDTDYKNMNQNMSCNNQVWEMNAQMLYTCTTTLTGIKDKEENNYYFRCRDKSKQGNEMRQSYEFNLMGTEELNILEVIPNNQLIKGSTSTVSVELEVRTDNGYNNGKSICSWSSTGISGSYVDLFDTGGNVHKQTLSLTTGSYDYYIRCVDLGGNSDTEEISFNVESDSSAPTVVRAYNDGSRIKVVTNEEAECSYGIDSCNFAFEEGIAMLAENGGTNHFAEWQTGQNYYIKCSDEYGNEPSTTDCSIIVRPSDL